MKQFDEIGKNMPFRETDEQVDALLQAIEARTLNQAPHCAGCFGCRCRGCAGNGAVEVAQLATLGLRRRHEQPIACRSAHANAR